MIKWKPAAEPHMNGLGTHEQRRELEQNLSLPKKCDQREHDDRLYNAAMSTVVRRENGDVVPPLGQAPGYPDHHVLGAAFAGKRGMYDCDLHILRSYCRPTCQK